MKHYFYNKGKKNYDISIIFFKTIICKTELILINMQLYQKIILMIVIIHVILNLNLNYFFIPICSMDLIILY